MSLISHIIILHITAHYTYRFILNASSEVLNIMSLPPHKEIWEIKDDNNTEVLVKSANFTVGMKYDIEVSNLHK